MGLKLRGHPGIGYTILVVVVFAVTSVIAHDVQTNKQSTQRNRDLILAYGYATRRSTVEQCKAANEAVLSRIATAEAIVQISARANPAVSHDLRSQLLLAAYVKKVNAAIEANNRGQLQDCRLPALGLPPLAPLTPGAKKILATLHREQAATATTVPGAASPPLSTPSRAPPTSRAVPARTTTTSCEQAGQPGASDCHRHNPKG